MDAKAYTEVNYILNEMSEDLRSKIPKNIRRSIEERMEKNYNVNIDRNLKNGNLLEDTEAILSVLYTDYFASEEERKIILNKESFLEIDKQRHINNNVQIKEIFPKKNKVIHNELLNIQEEKWYNKIISCIKRMIRKK